MINSDDLIVENNIDIDASNIDISNNGYDIFCDKNTIAIDTKITAEETFYKLVYNVLKKKITEDNYIENIITFFSKGYEIQNITNIKKIIYLLKKKKKNLSYMITMFLYAQHCLYETISQFMKISYKKFCKSRSKSRKNRVNTICRCSEKSLENILNFKIYIVNTLKYLDSFDSFYLAENSTNDLKITVSHYKEELIIRLYKLTKYLNYDQALYFNIKPIFSDELRYMDHKKIHELYLSVVNTLKFEFDRLANICDMYIDINNTIEIMILTKNTNIDMNKYDIFIETDNVNII